MYSNHTTITLSAKQCPHARSAGTAAGGGTKGGDGSSGRPQTATGGGTQSEEFVPKKQIRTGATVVAAPHAPERRTDGQH